jgi:hypothetical protein
VEPQTDREVSQVLATFELTSTPTSAPLSAATPDKTQLYLVSTEAEKGGGRTGTGAYIGAKDGE